MKNKIKSMLALVLVIISKLYRMSGKSKLIITLVLAALAIDLLIFCSAKIGKLDDENNELKRQVHAMSIAYSPMQRDTIHDSVSLISQPVVQIEKSEYKDLADKQLIKDLKLKIAQITAQHNTVVSTQGTVKLKKDSNIYTYKDKWTRFTLMPPDSLKYTITDSIVTFVAREYKHKFLFFKWGTKGYTVKVLNFNPHSTILYNTYIDVTQ